MKISRLTAAVLLVPLVGCEPRQPDDALELAQSALTSRIHGEAQSWIRSPGDDVSLSGTTVRFIADGIGDTFGFVDAMPAGTYDVSLRYAKRNVYGDYTVSVDAVPFGTLHGFADDKSDEWNTATFASVRVPSGAIISFAVTGKDPSSSDYDFKIDYLDFAAAAASGGTPTGGTVGPGGTRGTGGATGSGGAPSAGGGRGGQTGPCVPINPNATQQARNLLCYLQGQLGNHVLSGQQETSWSNPAGDIDFYVTNVGKSPAILGGDFLYPDGTSARAIAYWNAGGIPMIRYHMGAPPNPDSYQSSMRSSDLDKVVTPGTAENTSFNTKLDYAAAEIQKLQAAGVPLIWAPFHEVQANGWFWWSKGTGPQYVALWRYMYTYFTSTKHLDNILWLLPFSGSPSAAYYPGKGFADITGPDTYGTNQPFAGNYNSARAAVGTNIPLALHETGTIPQPDAMFPTTAPWLLFNVWAGFESSANTVATIRTAYGSAFTITRDEIPRLK
jgi:Glycosyl hydrolase family 26